MGRIGLARASIENLRKSIQVAEKAKREITEYLQKLHQSYSQERISYSNYVETLHRHFDGKTLQEWIEYYDHYVNECKKSIKDHKRDVVKNQLAIIFFSVILIFLLYASSIYLRPTLTGFFVEEPILEVDITNMTLETKLNLKTLPMKYSVLI